MKNGGVTVADTEFVWRTLFIRGRAAQASYLWYAPSRIYGHVIIICAPRHAALLIYTALLCKIGRAGYSGVC
jgi:hypothetical protein